MRHSTMRAGAILAAILLWVSAAVGDPPPQQNGAQASRPTDLLMDQIHIERSMQIMREDGLEYAVGLASDLLGPGGHADWHAMVDRIYDTSTMERTMRDTVATSWRRSGLSPDRLESFFGSELGQQVVGLEHTAHEAMMSADVEEAARERWRKRFHTAHRAFDGRVQLFQTLIETNQLVEFNVMTALNASLAFLRGLSDGGANDLGDDEIISQVWTLEEETRADVFEWLNAYLLLAYAPLDDDALATYMDLLMSDEGRAFNAALFRGYERVSAEISYALGIAMAAQQTIGEDL